MLEMVFKGGKKLGVVIRITEIEKNKREYLEKGKID